MHPLQYTTPFIYISSVLATIKILDIGLFDSRLDSIEDWDFWLRAAEMGFKFKKSESTTNKEQDVVRNYASPYIPKPSDPLLHFIDSIFMGISS